MIDWFRLPGDGVWRETGGLWLEKKFVTHLFLAENDIS
jgi:hypothetical protein